MSPGPTRELKRRKHARGGGLQPATRLDGLEPAALLTAHRPDVQRGLDAATRLGIPLAAGLSVALEETCGCEGAPDVHTPCDDLLYMHNMRSNKLILDLRNLFRNALTVVTVRALRALRTYLPDMT